ncbi:MAG: hypothetical protein O3A39_00695, partial [Proteobacteria bacterium]|nr:hypothetical protein [Pseudomonadota bacterium]
IKAKNDKDMAAITNLIYASGAFIRCWRINRYYLRGDKFMSICSNLAYRQSCFICRSHKT